MLRRIPIALVALLLFAGPASAGTIVVKLGLVPGKLQVGAVRISGSTVTVSVADGRGSGAGWTLRASAPVTVGGIAARCAANSTCTLPQLRTTPSGNVVLSAARGTGMGIMSLTLKLGPGTRAPLSFTVS